MHEARVDPERDVVEEETVARARHIDPPLDAVAEGGQGGDRVVAIEPEVAGEVVPRPVRDADERHVLLDCDLRDRGERAVAAGHAEGVGSGAPRELLQIVSVLEQAHLDAAGGRRVAELRDGR